MLILALVLWQLAAGRLVPGAVDGYIAGLLFAELAVEFFLVGKWVEGK
jgi:hypothetical protein